VDRFRDPLLRFDHATTSYSGAQPSQKFRKRSGFRKKSELWAVDDVSFSVAQGETYGLLGPNGSGKSSLIRVLSTLLIADSGYVEMLGFTLPEQAEEVRASSGASALTRFLQEAVGARKPALHGAALRAERAEAERA
jgi:ABC-2 type transport system ATP-binding protein